MGGVHCNYTVAYMYMRKPGGEGGAHYVRRAEGVEGGGVGICLLREGVEG